MPVSSKLPLKKKDQHSAQCHGGQARLWRNGTILAVYMMTDRYTWEHVGGFIEW